MSPQMRSAATLNVLTDQVFPSIDCVFPHGIGIFLHDNGRTDPAQTVREWFRERETSFFTRGSPPPQGPELKTVDHFRDVP